MDSTTACRNVVGLTRVFQNAAAQRVYLSEARRVYLSEVQTVCRNVVDPRMVFPIAVAQKAGLSEAQRDVRMTPDEDLPADHDGRQILNPSSPAIWNPAA